jgi:hypothetical protein
MTVGTGPKKALIEKNGLYFVEIDNFLSDIRAFRAKTDPTSGQIVSIRIDGIWYNIESVVVREETLSVTTKEEFVSEIGGEIQAPPWSDPTIEMQQNFAITERRYDLRLQNISDG